MNCFGNILQISDFVLCVCSSPVKVKQVIIWRLLIIAIQHFNVTWCCIQPIEECRLCMLNWMNLQMDCAQCQQFVFMCCGRSSGVHVLRFDFLGRYVILPQQRD